VSHTLEYQELVECWWKNYTWLYTRVCRRCSENASISWYEYKHTESPGGLSLATVRVRWQADP